MGITVDMFVKTYKANAKAKDKTFEEFINKHITTKYISYINKVAYCDSIVKATCHIKDGDREIIKVNSPNRYMFFTMKLIQLYTDININDDNVVGDYDSLNEIGAINVLMAAIPESEYTEFSTLLNMRMDDFYDNEYSINALLYNLKESFSLSEEVINSVLEELQKQANNTTDTQ